MIESVLPIFKLFVANGILMKGGGLTLGGGEKKEALSAFSARLYTMSIGVSTYMLDSTQCIVCE